MCELKINTWKILSLYGIKKNMHEGQGHVIVVTASFYGGAEVEKYAGVCCGYFYK